MIIDPSGPFERMTIVITTTPGRVPQPSCRLPSTPSTTYYLPLGRILLRLVDTLDVYSRLGQSLFEWGFATTPVIILKTTTRFTISEPIFC